MLQIWTRYFTVKGNCCNTAILRSFAACQTAIYACLWMIKMVATFYFSLQWQILGKKYILLVPEYIWNPLLIEMLAIWSYGEILLKTPTNKSENCQNKYTQRDNCMNIYTNNVPTKSIINLNIILPNPTPVPQLGNSNLQQSILLC